MPSSPRPSLEPRRPQISNDAGGFYCEHLWLTLLRWAETPACTVGRNDHGEPLCGFLHVPADDATCQGPAIGYTRGQSRSDLQALLTQVLAQWLPHCRRAHVRVLVTGYDNWGEIIDNPTAAFARDPLLAQGALVRALGRPLRVTAENAFYSGFYQRQYASLGRHALSCVTLRGQVFAVDDRTLGQGPASLARALHKFHPHIVLSLGVACSRPHYCCELHATDRGLDATGTQHIAQAAGTGLIRTNAALARALVAYPLL